MLLHAAECSIPRKKGDFSSALAGVREWVSRLAGGAFKGVPIEHLPAPVRVRMGNRDLSLSILATDLAAPESRLSLTLKVLELKTGAISTVCVGVARPADQSKPIRISSVWSMEGVEEGVDVSALDPERCGSVFVVMAGKTKFDAATPQGTVNFLSRGNADAFARLLYHPGRSRAIVLISSEALCRMEEDAEAADPEASKDSPASVDAFARALCGVAHVWITPMDGAANDRYRTAVPRAGAIHIVGKCGSAPKVFSRDVIEGFRHEKPGVPFFRRLFSEVLSRHKTPISALRVGDDEVLAMLLAGKHAQVAGEKQLSEACEALLKDAERESAAKSTRIEELERRLAETELKLFESQDRCAEAESRVESLNYHLECALAARAPGAAHGVPEPEALHEIPVWAEAVFADRLEFTTNAVSGLEKSVFHKPELVREIISVLGREFHDVFTGKIRMGVALASLAKTKARYSANQSDITVARQGYSRTHRGVRYECRKHICLGTARDPRHCFRIYFEWEPSRKRIIVLHAGEHLDNSLS